MLYKNKILTFQGVVTAITDVVYFGSPSEEKRLGGPKSLEFSASDSRTTIWSCSFDKNREDEAAQLHRNDAIILEGQLTNFPYLQHCKIRNIITNSPAFQAAPTSPEQIFDLDTLGKAYGENEMRFDSLYKDRTVRVKGIVTNLTNETAWGGVGRVYIASAPDVDSVGGAVEMVKFTWSCAFDASHADEMGRLQRKDAVVLEGQIALYMNFRHCRVVERNTR